MRPASVSPLDRIFAGLLPRRPHFRADLQAAGISYVDDKNMVADFHSLRMTFLRKPLELREKPRFCPKLYRNVLPGKWCAVQGSNLRLQPGRERAAGGSVFRLVG
jgi:hypothetical protein